MALAAVVVVELVAPPVSHLVSVKVALIRVFRVRSPVIAIPVIVIAAARHRSVVAVVRIVAVS